MCVCVGGGGGYSHFFFKRRVGPSIYRLPPKISENFRIYSNISKQFYFRTEPTMAPLKSAVSVMTLMSMMAASLAQYRGGGMGGEHKHIFHYRLIKSDEMGFLHIDLLH